MEKLAQIMNSFEKFLEAYDTCSKSEVIYNWSALKKEIEKILEENDNVCLQEIKEQIIKNDCGVKYHISEGGVLTPIKEVDIDSWQDGNAAVVT